MSSYWEEDLLGSIRGFARRRDHSLFTNLEWAVIEAKEVTRKLTEAADKANNLIWLKREDKASSQNIKDDKNIWHRAETSKSLKLIGGCVRVWLLHQFMLLFRQLWCQSGRYQKTPAKLLPYLMGYEIFSCIQWWSTSALPTFIITKVDV